MFSASYAGHGENLPKPQRSQAQTSKNHPNTGVPFEPRERASRRRQTNVGQEQPAGGGCYQVAAHLQSVVSADRWVTRSCGNECIEAMLHKDFPLAWRWTDPEYALLPMDVLERIESYPPDVAERLFRQSNTFHDAGGLDKQKFAYDQIETVGVGRERVSEWLVAQHDNNETRVDLSWQPDVAVSTTWGIFARYWDEFCYPGADDLDVWSEAHDWVLLYHHEEFMQFGRPREG